jgi:hypothetical protein
MAASRAMCRLLHVLEMQEEQRLAEMEGALADLKRLEHELTVAIEQDCAGRRRISASAETGEIIDRLSGLEQSREALRQTGILKPRIAESQEVANTRRGDFLSKRVERRQAKTVVENLEAVDGTKATRREQRDLDDWFLGKVRH